ncbi:MAG TPA: NAD(P)-dependent oxidoreductase [Anaeromyxobacteraceae bacterium]|nr:NAD(P)-dependent oxidoreductase [Anaeromyxobacteraceae bacterium]HET8558568.1 NAD(P)-dependent oxidoreductase [Gaiellaceae bacterium]
MPRAVLVGGTGMIGRAAARALASDGWEVVAVSRSGTLPEGLEELGVQSVGADRADDAQLRAAIGPGADVLLDTVAYGREHGEQLNALAGVVGSLIVISSASVYADDEGRALDGEGDPPSMPVPILETQRTAEPGDATYSTRKAELEQMLLAGPLPATLLRACAIHGPGAKLPREIFFVKRAVDGRRRVALAWNGESRFHTTSVANLAELIRLAAAKPGDRALNAGDPDPPTTLGICRAIGEALGHEFEPVLLPGDEYDNPWGAPEPKPFVVSMAAAEQELGYRPVITYPEAVRETCAWLVAELENGRSWDGTYLEGMLDYAAEDEALASQS